MTALTWENTRAGYTALIASAALLPAQKSEALRIAAQLNSTDNVRRYRIVETKTGVPWWVVAALHHRESGGDFATYLGNGQPLNKVTTIAPKGRGPFLSWEAGAIDALTKVDPPSIQITDLPSAAFYAEHFNGLGYFEHHENDPYVWAWTNHQQTGKYTSDGKWERAQWDTQPGTAALWLALEQLGALPARSGAKSQPPDLKIGPQPIPTTDPTTPTPKGTPMTPVPQNITAQQRISEVKNIIHTIESVLPFVGMLVPGQYGQLARSAAPILQDITAWIDKSTDPATTHQDVLNLIETTFEHVTQLLNQAKQTTPTT